MRLMIVDDEQYVRKSTRALIDCSRLGITEILEASGGYEALQIVERSNPEVAIVDMNMAAMNGVELLHEFKKRNIKIQVLVVSGFDDFSYCQEALRYGAKDYILKPVHAEELNSVLKTICDTVEKKTPLQIMQNEFIRPCTQDDHLSESIDRIVKKHSNCWFGSVRIRLVDPIKAAEKYGDKDIATLTVMQYLRDEYRYGETIKSLFSNEVYWILVFSKERFANREEAHAYMIELCKICSKKMSKRDLGLIFGIGNIYEDNINSDSLRNSATGSIIDGNLRDALHLLSADDKGTLSMTYEIAKINYISLISYADKTSDNRLLDAAKDALKKAIEKEQYVSFKMLLNLWQEIRLTMQLEKIDYDLIFEVMNIETIIDKVFAAVAMAIDETKAKVNPEIDQLMVDIYSYLVNNCCSKITLQSLSDRFFFSQSYLCKHFKVAYGMSIAAFLKELRLNRSIAFIQKTSMPIAEIANVTGFNDSSYFIKSFREKYGITPLDLRKPEKQ